MLNSIWNYLHNFFTPLFCIASVLLISFPTIPMFIIGLIMILAEGYAMRQGVLTYEPNYRT